VLAAAAAAATTLGVKPLVSRFFTRRTAGEAVCSLTTLEEKLAALRARSTELGGFDKVMLDWGIQSITPGGFLSAIAADEAKRVQHYGQARRFLADQYRAHPAGLVQHMRRSNNFLQVFTHGCSVCRRSIARPTVPDVGSWASAMASIARVANAVCPQVWSTKTVSSLMTKVLFPLTGTAYCTVWKSNGPYLRALELMRSTKGWMHCWDRSRALAHVALWPCSRCPGLSSFKRCQAHGDGTLCVGQNVYMRALSTVALLADHPLLAPAFTRRNCFVRWWWRRWVDRKAPPSSVLDWVAQSSLLTPTSCTVNVRDICGALVNFRPSLQMWLDAVSVPAASWPTTSVAETKEFFGALTLPAPHRRGMEAIVNELLRAAAAIGRAASFVEDGSLPVMLDSATLVRVLPDDKFTNIGSRQQLSTTLRRLFGEGFTKRVACPVIFSLHAVARACGLRSTLDAFPCRAVVADVFSRLDDDEAGTADDEACAADDDACATDDEAGAADDEAGAADDEEGAADDEAGAADDEAGAADDEAGVDEAGTADDEAGAADDEAGAADDEAGAADDEAGAADNEAVMDADGVGVDDEEMAEIVARFVDPQLLRRRLRAARLSLAPGVTRAELLCLSRAERPLLFAHGTTVEAAALARRWGLHDPRLRGWMGQGVPPACMALYFVPVLNDVSIFSCASFALAKHTAKDKDGRLVEPAKVEVVLFRATPIVYDPTKSLAGRHVFGGPNPSRPLNPALGVLNLLQLRAGRFVNWVTMCGLQVMRLICVHPVAAETGIAWGMLGGAVDGTRSVSDVFHPDGRNRMEPLGSITFEVVPPE